MEYSYGIVPIYINNKGEYIFLLIKQNSKKNSFRGFPKGHKNTGETGIQSAKRELREETGIEGVQINNSKKRSLEYTYNLSGVDVNKKVFFRYGFVLDTKVTIQNSEISDYLRCTKRQVLSTLTHKNAKIMFEKICDYLKIE